MTYPMLRTDAVVLSMDSRLVSKGMAHGISGDPIARPVVQYERMRISSFDGAKK